MIRSAASKVMGVGRAAALPVVLAVMLVVVFGVSSPASAHKGYKGLLHLGHSKAVATVTTLVGKVATGSSLVVKNPSGGSALGLQVSAGQAPLTVNADAGTATNLDADKLDGKHSSEFAPAAAEAWRELGAAGEPTFTNSWRNSGGSNSTAAFYKDPWGVVHLKGMVENPYALSGGTYTMFVLPCGYGPSKDEAHAVLSNNALGRVTIYRSLSVCPGDQTSAWVRAMPPSSNVWVSLDGITYRAAGS